MESIISAISKLLQQRKILSLELFPSQIIESLSQECSIDALKIKHKGRACTILEENALAMDLKFSNILSRYLFLNSFKVFRLKIKSYSKIIEVTRFSDSLKITLSEEDIHSFTLECSRFNQLKYELFLLSLLAGENQSFINALKQLFQIELSLRGQDTSLYSEYIGLLKLIQLRFRKLSQGWWLMKFIVKQAFSRLLKLETRSLAKDLLNFSSEAILKQPRNYYIFPFRTGLLELIGEEEKQCKSLLEQEEREIKKIIETNPSEVGAWKYYERVLSMLQKSIDEAWVTKLKEFYNNNEVLEDIFKEMKKKKI